MMRTQHGLVQLDLQAPDLGLFPVLAYYMTHLTRQRSTCRHSSGDMAQCTWQSMPTADGVGAEAG
jgi:hypothetical protein